VIERHAAVLLAYDQVPKQHELTVQAVESLLLQDIGPLDLLLIDNGSIVRDTPEYFNGLRELYLDRGDDTRIHICQNRANISPVKIANRAFPYFWKLGHEKVLAIPNDVRIPLNAYRVMNEWPRGLVCGSMTEDVAFEPLADDQIVGVNECTPAAVAVVRKWFHDALVARDGYYLDENYWLYASDCDFAVRMALCGLRGIQLNLPYYHYGSAHWRLLSEEEGRRQTDRSFHLP
jgi:hypothetical protein